MSEAVIPVHLESPLLEGAQSQAAQEGISLEQWLLSLAGERLRTAYITEKYFSRSASPDDAAEMLRILDMVPDASPIPRDELPENV